MIGPIILSIELMVQLALPRSKISALIAIINIKAFNIDGNPKVDSMKGNKGL